MKSTIIVMLMIAGVLLYIPTSTSFVVVKKQLVAYCANLSTSTQAIAGVPMNLTFACGLNPAFTTVQPILALPSYSLPVGYTALYVNGTKTLKLTSGVSVSLSQGNYTYLARFDGSAVSSLSSFSITWTSK